MGTSFASYIAMIQRSALLANEPRRLDKPKNLDQILLEFHRAKIVALRYPEAVVTVWERLPLAQSLIAARASSERSSALVASVQ